METGNSIRPATQAASTGPRPRGRGMRATTWGKGSRTSGFNGAAPARARNVAGGAEGSGAEGVASTGPRPRGRGMLIIFRPLFGRELCFNGAAPARARNGSGSGGIGRRRTGFNGAAPARARNDAATPVAPTSARRASTGPRPRGRGMRTISLWETPAAYRFNGAAPARARNAPSALKSQPSNLMLQRGRARAGAECRSGSRSVRS